MITSIRLVVLMSLLFFSLSSRFYIVFLFFLFFDSIISFLSFGNHAHGSSQYLPFFLFRLRSFFSDACYPLLNKLHERLISFLSRYQTPLSIPCRSWITFISSAYLSPYYCLLASTEPKSNGCAVCNSGVFHILAETLHRDWWLSIIRTAGQLVVNGSAGRNFVIWYLQSQYTSNFLNEATMYCSYPLVHNLVNKRC